LLRKIVGGFLKNLGNKQLPTATAQKVNAAVADQDLAKMMEEFQRQAPRKKCLGTKSDHGSAEVSSFW
jgi:hypothetical protein